MDDRQDIFAAGGCQQRLLGLFLLGQVHSRGEVCCQIVSRLEGRSDAQFSDMYRLSQPQVGAAGRVSVLTGWGGCRVSQLKGS